MRKAFLLTGLIFGCLAPAAASSQPSPMTGAPLVSSPFSFQPPASVPPPRSDPAFTRLRSDIIDLRRHAIALQARDGGTLTAEHRDYIQVRIDAAYRRYHDARP